MKNLCLLCISILFFTFPLYCEPVQLDLDECISLALAQNPDFRISTISLETADYEVKSKWNNFLPQFSAGAGISGSSSFLSGPPSFSWSTNGSLNLSLSLKPGIIKTLESIRLNYEKEYISYETARHRLISNIEKEFYFLITNRSNLEIIESNLELARKNFEQAQSNYNFGMTSELSVLQAEVKAANLEPAFKQAQAAYDSRMREFALVLGLEPESNFFLEGTLETFSVDLNADTLISDFLSDRRDIAALLKDIEIMKNNRAISSLNNRLPGLSLSSGWSVSGPQQWSDRFSAGLSINVPIDDLIPGSSTSVSIYNQDAQIEQAEIRLQKTMNEARTEIRNLVMQLETYASNMELSEINIKLAEKSYFMSEESYAHGTIRRLDVEDAQQALLSAKNQYLASQYEYLTALIQLRDALGMDSIDELYSTGEKK